MTQHIEGLETIVGGKLRHIVVNVYPSPADPGRNVRVAGELLRRFTRTRYSLTSEPTSWESEVIKLVPSSEQFPGIHVLDWSPEKGQPWGGRSDNLLSVSMEGRPAYGTTLLLAEFFRRNGYKEVSYEMVSSDGSYDLEVNDLFVSFKFNVNPG